MPDTPLPISPAQESLQNQALPPGIDPKTVATAAQAAAPSVAYQYAGFWMRYAAIVVDGFVLGLPVYLISVILGVIVLGDTGGASPAQTAFSAFSTLITLLLIIFFLVRMSATPGKMFFGLKIIKDGGEKIDFNTAVIREGVGRIVCALTLNIGYLMAGFDSKKQGLHDKLAKTYVVYNQPPSGLKKFLAVVIIFLPFVIMFFMIFFLFALLGAMFGGFRAGYNSNINDLDKTPSIQQDNFKYPGQYKVPDDTQLR